MKYLRPLLFLLLLINLYSLEAKPLDSLFIENEIILSGKIINIVGPSIEDLGTEVYHLDIKIETVYKQNFYISPSTIRINCEVSNLTCKNIPLINCIRNYLNQKSIFFLNRKHFVEGDKINDENTILFNAEIEKRVQQINNSNLIEINYFDAPKSCNANCKFCQYISDSNWKKVKRILKRNLYTKNFKLKEHKNIKWISGDREILASLPSYSGTRLMFETKNGEIPAYIHTQIGYYKSFASWIPYLLYRSCGIQAHKYFKISNTNSLKFLSFTPNYNDYKIYFGYEKQNYSRLICDTSAIKTFGANMPLSDELVLLASINDGAYNMYLDYQTMPDYIERSKGYLQELSVQNKVYLLSISAAHTRPEIASEALRLLKILNNKKCIPFLILVAEHCSTINVNNDNNEYIKFQLQLIETLDYLCGCKRVELLANNSIYNLSNHIKKNISVWKTKFKIIS